MQILPVINCVDAACVREKLAHVKSFLAEGEWLHLDVTDGVFSMHETWTDAGVWAAMAVPFQLEVHLMVRHPEQYIGAWLAAGVKRVIVHEEALTPESAEAVAATCRAHNVEVMLSLNPETPIVAAETYADLFSEFQILAVHPGPASQTFMPVALEKVAALRAKFPNAIIEVDGGMTPDVARTLKNAGVSMITSDHYIWSAEDPKEAYGELKNI